MVSDLDETLLEQVVLGQEQRPRCHLLEKRVDLGGEIESEFGGGERTIGDSHLTREEVQIEDWG